MLLVAQIVKLWKGANVQTFDFFKLLHIICAQSEPDLVQIRRYGLFAVKIGQILAAPLH